MNSNIINFNYLIAAAESPNLEVDDESSLEDQPNEPTTDEDNG